MELSKTQTEKNLRAAFAAESQARNRYIFSGDLAEQAGLHDIADVFYELAANGLRFTQFYNTARCCPTRASLLTGLYSHQAGVGVVSGSL